MRKEYTLTFLLIMTVSLALMTFGCKSEGPAEEVGEKIDQSIEKTKDAVEDVSDTITGKGPAEKAGEKIDEAAEAVKESVKTKN